SAGRARGALVRARTGDDAAAGVIRPLAPEALDSRPDPHGSCRQQRKPNGGGAHILDALDGRIGFGGHAVAQFFYRRIEQLDNEEKDQHTDQRIASGHVRGEKKGQGNADYQQSQLLAKGGLRSHHRYQAIPAIDRRAPDPFHASRPFGPNDTYGFSPVYSISLRPPCITASYESRRYVQPERPRGAGDRRVERPRRAIFESACR